jgi:hypothetical protein
VGGVPEEALGRGDYLRAGHPFLVMAYWIVTLGLAARAMRVPLRPATRWAPCVRAAVEADVLQPHLISALHCLMSSSALFSPN